MRDFQAFLRTLAALFGDEDPNGTHEHECKTCGEVWEHANSCAGDYDAHTCSCGELVWDRRESATA